MDDSRYISVAVCFSADNFDLDNFSKSVGLEPTDRKSVV